MKLTKYEHACLVLEISGDKLIIDPGAFTMPLGDIGDVIAVVITHEHPDHWTPEQLGRILARNPDAKIYGPAGVKLAAADFEIIESHDGDSVEVGPFTLDFYGERHAVIHSSIPLVDNVGVMVNQTLFYPGDAFTVPPVPVDTLAVPAGAPWLKIGETMDYVTAVAPKGHVKVVDGRDGIGDPWHRRCGDVGDGSPFRNSDAHVSSSRCRGRRDSGTSMGHSPVN